MSEGGQWLDSTKGLPVLIVGADDGGEGVLSAMRRGGSMRYNVVGFLAASETEVGRLISGIPVLGTFNQTIEMAQKYEVRDLLIASRGLTGKQVRDIINTTTDHDISVKVLPSYDQMLDGHVDWRPRTVSITDLLRRDPVELDTQNLNRWLGGKTLLVTGAAGSIGSEICKAVAIQSR